MDLVARYGPWAIIAGASEGTGRALALLLAKNGVASVLVARREAPLRLLVDDIRRETGLECVAACIDLGAADACDKLAAVVGSREVGLFISNAGADPHGAHFLSREIATWQALVQRNVMTMMATCHHFSGAMCARGRGGLLLVNSGACYGGSSFMAAYAASKAFMLCFGESLWAELRPQGIDVLNLVMGQTDTPALRQLLADKGLPLPPGLAAADEVARVALERLPHGPVHNWGQDDAVAGYAPNSAAARRERVQMIDVATRRVFGNGTTPATGD